MSAVERRPGRGRASTVTFPEAWTERHGPPPERSDELRAWVRVNHLDDLVAFAEGRSVPWLDVDSAKRELRAMESR